MVCFNPEEKAKSIYHQLVHDDADLVGMIAYSLYKSEKIRYIEEHRMTNNDEKPNVVQLASYQEGRCEEEYVNGCRRDAEEYLLNTVNELLKDRVKLIEIDDQKVKEEKKQLENRKNELDRIEKDTREKNKIADSREKYCKAVTPRGFWSGVGQSLTASLIMMAITVLFALFLYFNFDLTTFFKNLVIDTVKS